MKITITMDLTQENIDKLKALLPDEQTSPSDSAPESSAEQAKPKTKPAVQSEDSDAEPITKTDIRAVALKLSKAGKQKELAEIFAKFGCKKLSDFDSRTEDYPALMKELVSVDA